MLALLKYAPVLAILAVIANPARADDRLTLDYAVYAGGIYAMNAGIGVSLAPGARRYDISVTAKTHGFIDRLFPWKGLYKTSGRMQDDDLVPASHAAESIWRDESKTTKISFDTQGRFVKIVTLEDGREKSRDAPRAISDGAQDMLTSLLDVMKPEKRDKACIGAIPVFDGKRRFDIVLKRGEWETMPDSRYSVYSGKALRCVIEVKPVAGFRKKDLRRGWIAVQEHSRERNKLPTVWLAEANDGLMVPVRMEISSGFGAVIAHLGAVSAGAGYFKDNRKNQR